MSRLSDVISAANKEGISARELARRARERGHSLNHDTAARYVRGDHGTPDEGTLVALSDVLGIPLKRLRAAADLPSEIIEAYTPPAEASRLTRRQRRAVDEIIRSMLDPVGRPRTLKSVPPAAETSSRRRSTPAKRAARRGRAEPPVD
jgi:transcriptional regulator with XRE-family HTH domain